MHILKVVCYMTTSFPGIHFFTGALEAIHVKETVFILQLLVATIHYNKWPVIDSRKIEGHVYLRKIILALLFKGAYLFHRTSGINFCLKSTVLNRDPKIAHP